MNQSATLPIEDVQSSPDLRRLPINRVGIKSIRHPVRIADQAGEAQHTIANFNMYVSLPHHLKGTHMSRFVEILNAREDAFSVAGFEPLLRAMIERLEAESGHVSMAFPYFVNKAAPVSGVKSLLDYEVTLTGEILDGVYSLETKVLVPITSLCPCSKKISEYGAHNQRSHVTVTVKAYPGRSVGIEELIRLVEAQASSELYGLLKRPDEKFVTERAYDNPKFVEDLVRDIAAQLNAHPDVASFVVESENFESIHNHSAYALIERDKTAG